MGTKIPWADETWNPMTGCTPVSEACDHCYARTNARRFSSRTETPIAYRGDVPVAWKRIHNRDYFTPTFHPDRLDKPLHWRKPRRIFVCSMSDLFHEAFTDSQRDQVFARIAACPQHTFMVLTKRPEKMREYVLKAFYDEDCSYQGFYEMIEAIGIPDATPMVNVWLGVTVENQARADERIPILLDTPAAVRFVSVEPMLGPVEFGPLEGEMGFTWLHPNLPGMVPGIDWVIAGGENGPGARPMQPEWALDVWRQCKAAGVPFWFKQRGDCLKRDAKWYGEPTDQPWGFEWHQMVATREFPAVQT